MVISQIFVIKIININIQLDGDDCDLCDAVLSN